jgi:hypothetical protein
MDMNARLDEAFTDRPWSGPSDKAFRRNAVPKSLVNYRTKLNKVFIGQLFGSLIVQVYEKLETFRLLFDDIQFCS